MKKIVKIACLIFVIFVAIGNVCFADVIMANEDPRNHGMGRYPNGYENTYVNRYENKEIKNKNRAIKDNEKEFDMDIIKVAAIGVLIITIVICAAVIIVQIIKTGKEKNNDK